MTTTYVVDHNHDARLLCRGRIMECLTLRLAEAEHAHERGRDAPVDAIRARIARHLAADGAYERARARAQRIATQEQQKALEARQKALDGLDRIAGRQKRSKRR